MMIIILHESVQHSPSVKISYKFCEGLKLLNLYSSPIRMIKSRRMRWAGHVARTGKKRKAYRILVGKPDSMRPLRRPRRRWVDNMKMDLRGIGWDDMNRINLAQNRDQWRALLNM
jgi:hypothetical protein